MSEPEASPEASLIHEGPVTLPPGFVWKINGVDADTGEPVETLVYRAPKP